MVSLLLLGTLIVFTWPLWVWWLLSYPRQKVITRQKGLDSPNIRVLAKETCVWEGIRVIRERSIYAEPE